MTRFHCAIPRARLGLTRDNDRAQSHGRSLSLISRHHPRTRSRVRAFAVHDAAAEVEPVHQEVERLRAAAARAERSLRASDAVTAVLVSETTLDAAIPRVLATLAGALGCASAAYWVAGRDGLAVTARWPSDDAERRPVAPP